MRIFWDTGMPSSGGRYEGRLRAAIFAGLAAAVAISLNFDALAQGTVRPNERFCLQTSDPMGAQGPLCRFETREQCNASKTAPADLCYLNPAANGRG